MGEELKKLFMQYGISEDAATVFAMQMNNDGQNGVTVDEFIDFMKEKGDEVTNENESKVELLLEIVERFHSFDPDGSETITWDEFQAIMQDMNVTDDQAKAQWWWYVDKNHDNVMTFNEFYDGFFKQAMKEQYPEEFGNED